MNVSDCVSGLIIADRELRVIAADRFFLDGIGHPVEHLEGRRVAEVLGAPAGGAPDPLACLSLEGGRVYTRRVSASGRPRTLRVSSAPLKVAGGEKQVMLTVEDLTPPAG